VWWARRQDASPRLAGLLDDVERERWTRYRLEPDRERFLVGCALAKTVAGLRDGRPPADVSLDRTCAACGKPHGKPRVEGSDLELSVSHSGDRIAVAAVRGVPAGVDVEQAGRPRRVADLERHVLSDRERAAVTGGSRERDFLVAWTRKEAVTKATGDGLGVSFREVVLTPPGQPPAVLAWPYPGPPELVSLFDLDAGPGYLAALAVLGPCDEVVTQDGTSLLADVSL